MGGYEYGEIASHMVVSYLSDHYDELLSFADDSEGLKYFISELNDWFCKTVKAKYGSEHMGATICALTGNRKKTVCFNVGDSRCYLFKAGKLKRISKDNNEGQRMFDLGLLSKEEAEKFPNKKALYKFVGMDCILIPDIYEIDGDLDHSIMLLCSDGLCDVVSDEEIEEMLNKKNLKIEDKGRFLVGIAAERDLGHGDNITLLILER